MSLTVLLMGIILGMVTFQPAVLPFEEIKLAAQQYHQSSSAEFPLMNKIAIVTGSTSGLGMSIATSLYKVCVLCQLNHMQFITFTTNQRIIYPFFVHLYFLFYS